MSEIISLHSSNEEDDMNNIFVLRLINSWCSNDEKIDSNNDDIQNNKKSRYKTNGFTQFRWLVWRNFVDLFKNPFEIRLRIILALVSFERISIKLLFFIL
jgi:hypothetical protein